MTNSLIVKRNDLLNVSYSLSLNEQRILLGCISQVDSRLTLDKEKTFEVSVQSIKDLFGSQNASHFYTEIKNAVERLSERWIVIRGDKRVVKLRWVYKIEYLDNEATIRLNFSPDVIPYLSEITERFTKYRLNDVKDFKCIYSLRLYELFAQYQAIGSREIEVDELRILFELENKYPSFGELKRSVIDKALYEINLHSNMNVSCGFRKRGRKVLAFQFSFETKIKKIDDAYERKSVSIQEYVRLNPVITKGKTEMEVIRLMQKNKIDKK